MNSFSTHININKDKKTHIKFQEQEISVGGGGGGGDNGETPVSYAGTTPDPWAVHSILEVTGSAIGQALYRGNYELGSYRFLNKRAPDGRSANKDGFDFSDAGTDLVVGSGNGNATLASVISFTLNDPWNVDSATTSGEFVPSTITDLSEDDDYIKTVRWANSGSILYVVTKTQLRGAELITYSLSTPYVLSSRTEVSIEDFSRTNGPVEFSKWNDVTFTSDGLTAFVTSMEATGDFSTSEVIRQYSLSSPRDITSAARTLIHTIYQSDLGITDDFYSPRGIQLSSDEKTIIWSEAGPETWRLILAVAGELSSWTSFDRGGGLGGIGAGPAWKETGVIAQPPTVSADKVFSKYMEISWTNPQGNNAFEVLLDGVIHNDVTLTDADKGLYTIHGLVPETQYIVEIQDQFGETAFISSGASDLLILSNALAVTTIASPTVDDFEDLSLGTLPTGYSQTPGSNASWAATSDKAASGVISLVSDDITNSQTASIDVTVEFTETQDISFKYYSPTEGGWDFLNLKIDGVTVFSGSSGHTDGIFRNAAYYIDTPGTYVITFEYKKDSSVSELEDRVYIDDVDFGNGVIQ